jgi:hypothetical protein
MNISRKAKNGSFIHFNRKKGILICQTLTGLPFLSRKIGPNNYIAILKKE